MNATKSLGIVFFSLLLVSYTLFAQIILEGQVTDLEADPIANALVEVIDQADSNRKFSDLTDDQGRYLLQIYPTGVGDSQLKIPVRYPLLKNYPNPFNPTTRIVCELPFPSNVRIDIYNILGQKVKTLFDGFLPTSAGQFMWDATNDHGQGVSAGVYLCTLTADGISLTRKMLLLDGNSQPLNVPHSGDIQSSSSRPVSSAKPNLSDTFIFRVSGKNIETYEQAGLVITSNMVLNVTVAPAVTDIDGNTYRIVKIGDQWWMAENLRVTRYSNGDAVTHVTESGQWSSQSSGAYCDVENNPAHAKIYGRLYNWNAVNDARNIAPAGWHVASDEEWKQLEMTLGMSRSEADLVNWRGTGVGGKLKTTGTLEDGTGLWRSPNEGATNESGFSAVPAGYRYESDYYAFSENAFFWSTKEVENGMVMYRLLYNTLSTSGRFTSSKETGMSVRCVKDGAPVTLVDIKISPQNKVIGTGDSLQLTCMAEYSYGDSKDVTAEASWSLSPGYTGRIDANGLLFAHDILTGTELATAEYQGKRARTMITITDSVDTGMVYDIDGNVYSTVKIGDLWWMTENLKVTHYRNGEDIPNVTDPAAWSSLKSGAWCDYNNDPANGTIYGPLYNWYAVNDSRNIAPEGWHVPTHEEWQSLIDYLGGPAVAGGKLKSKGTRDDGSGLWYSPNVDATDDYCFSALPGGSRGTPGDFFYLGGRAYFWSITEQNTESALIRYIDSYYSSISSADYAKEGGCSVRCVKDASSKTIIGIRVEPKSTSVKNGETLQLTCNAVHPDGSTQDVSVYAAWRILPGSAGSISAAGLFTASATVSGTETVIAELSGFKATALIMVGEGETGTVSDIDGNVYPIVKIGDQWWMAENLKVTRYQNGDSIT
ncbi:T9SS type A sorting domain-containing protein, partial [candidate division KSB1 bacterium]|nr:T9SS type A sorting domain-containing protein [candidate division KSB1 bacterium]